MYAHFFTQHAHTTQAVDCCHRLGQTKPVVVYRMIAAGTVEEKMYDSHLKDKSQLSVLDEGDSNVTEYYFQANELHNLFSLEEPGKCDVMEKIGRLVDGPVQELLALGALGLSQHAPAEFTQDDEESDTFKNRAIDFGGLCCQHCLDDDDDDDDWFIEPGAHWIRIADDDLAHGYARLSLTRLCIILDELDDVLHERTKRELDEKIFAQSNRRELF